MDSEENGTGAAVTKVCGNDECCCVIPAGCVICPVCGFENLLKVDVLPETHDNLIEFNNHKKRIERFAKKRGFDINWTNKVLNHGQ